MTDSSTGGYLLPNGAIAPPLEDGALDDFLHDLVAGITGLAADLVRPRWQEEPPNLPPRSTDWVAFGVVSRTSDPNAAVTHDGAAAEGEGADIVIRHEQLDLLASFYGPNCQAYGARLRDGLAVGQNREALLLAGMGLSSVGDLTRAPELIKGKWLSRADLPVQIRREIRREYPILNLTRASGDVASQRGSSAFNTNP